jgi:hypothetical protein
MSWQAMALLGAYHGINPGMGWLFAVALALQQGSARGVWRAVPPIAVGHAAAVGGVVATAMLAGVVVPADALRSAVASTLVAFGVYRLWRHRHPRYGGMRVGFRDLTVWSFLMASAHGAGFMVLPFVMPGPAALAAAGHEHAHHLAAAQATTAATASIMAVAVHSAAYLTIMSLTAWVVYRRVGLNVLRTAWLNLDWLWAGALVVTGVIVLVS